MQTQYTRGKLVSEEVIFGLLSKWQEEGYCRGESGFILDGIPRTRVQAEVLDKIADIDLVLNIKCTEDCMLKGLSGDQACSACSDLLGMHSSTITRNLHSNVSTAELNGANLEGVGRDKLRSYAEQAFPTWLLRRTGNHTLFGDIYKFSTMWTTR